MNDPDGHPASWKAGKSYSISELHTSYLLNFTEGDDGTLGAVVATSPRYIMHVDKPLTTLG